MKCAECESFLYTAVALSIFTTNKAYLNAPFSRSSLYARNDNSQVQIQTTVESIATGNHALLRIYLVEFN